VLTSAESNCYLVADERTRETIVVDPGADAERIQARLDELDLRPILAVITHAHWDHVNAAGALGVPVAMHPADRELLDRAPEITRDRTGVLGPRPPRIERPLDEGVILRAGELSLKVLHTPGHTPGSICLMAEVDVLFTGDTLMAGWVGRTDGFGGDQQAIRQSLWQRLLQLPDQTRVYAGHLEPTTIGRERIENPYLNGSLPLR
jgi:hydroxyacylglutathione hydrolase